MGSQYIQSRLWEQHPNDWASMQEPIGNSGYEYALHFLEPKPSENSCIFLKD